MFRRAKIEDLIGATMEAVENHCDEEVVFTATDGRSWKLYHSQDCCESVRVEDVVGELDWLVGSPLLMAEESESAEPPDDVERGYGESQTWTFYRLATVRGYVTIRWLGESNGYYSESVDFIQLSGPTTSAPTSLPAKPAPAPRVRWGRVVVGDDDDV